MLSKGTHEEPYWCISSLCLTKETPWKCSCDLFNLCVTCPPFHNVLVPSWGQWSYSFASSELDKRKRKLSWILGINARIADHNRNVEIGSEIESQESHASWILIKWWVSHRQAGVQKDCTSEGKQDPRVRNQADSEPPSSWKSDRHRSEIKQAGQTLMA